MDRENQTLAVHLLNVTDLDDVERRRAAVLKMEERVVRAFGSAEEIAAVTADEESVAAAAESSGRRTP